MAYAMATNSLAPRREEQRGEGQAEGSLGSPEAMFVQCRQCIVVYLAVSSELVLFCDLKIFGNVFVWIIFCNSMKKSSNKPIAIFVHGELSVP